MYKKPAGAFKKLVFVSIAPYIYITPAMVFICLVYLYPIMKIFLNSFFRLGKKSVFIGLDNYRVLFLEDGTFKASIIHNFILLLSIPIMVVLSLILARLVYEKVRGWRFYQTVIFLPYILASTIVGIVWSYILRSDGVLNSLLNAINMGILARNWLGSKNLALLSVMAVIIWRETAFGFLLFLARLMGINEEYFDVAEIEGANWWQTMRYVIIPELRYVIQFYVVLSMIIMFSWVFNYIFVMTSGGPGHSTYVTEFYMYLLTFLYNAPGYASAVGVILFLIVLIFVVIQYRMRRET